MRLHEVAKGSAGQGLQVLTREQCDDLHVILLEMLDDIMTICRENDLKFILIGGSAIGALRHGGFIPWDDDIDIAMPRKDLDRFTAIVRQQSKYTMLHPQDKRNYGRVIPKFRLAGTEYRTILERDLDECGVNIDIYPIENVYDSNLKLRFQGFMAMAMGFCLSCRRLYKGRKWTLKMAKGLGARVRCVLGFLLSFASMDTWARWTDNWNSRCKDETTKRVCIPTDGRHFFGEIFQREFLLDVKTVDFEGRTCAVPKAVDEYLHGIYGEFMTIPPAEKQVRNCYLSYDLGKYGKDESKESD